MKRLIVFLLVLMAAELVWRLVGDRFVVLNALGELLVLRLYPDIPPDASAEIARDYGHAAWLLGAVALASVAVYVARATRSADMSAKSRRMGLVTVALVVAGLLLVITSEGVITSMQRTWRVNDDGGVKGDPVLALVRTCHEAIRKHFAGKPIVTIDSGLDPAQAYIYTYELDRAPSVHFVRLARSSSEVSPASVAPSLRGLAPPIQGGYIVQGLVLYSGDTPAVNWSDHREYHCAMLVTGDRYEVRDLRFNMVR